MYVSFSVAAAVMTAHIGSLGCSIMICVLPLSPGIGLPLTNGGMDGPACFVLVACSI